MTTTTKKFKKEIEIKGGVTFSNLDPLAGRLELEDHENLSGNRRFDIPPDLFPDDFESAKYKVTGEYSIKIVIKEK